MEQAIRDRFHPGILAEARRRYAIAPDAVQLLDGFESFIYEFERDGAAYILRLGHSRRRSPDLIRGEVDWINYLAAGGAGAARAVLSAEGNLVEEIPDEKDGRFLATAFIKAPGGPPWQMGGWREGWIENYGRLLGRIHALSKAYRPGDPAWRRPAWDDATHIDIPDVDPMVTAKHGAIRTYLQRLPRDEEGYGMIHQDAHAGNLFVDENGRITLFDFDDCVYGHFVYDIAMVLFYALTNLEDPEAYGRYFWPIFWRGYRMENELDPAWLAEIPAFMKLREIALYAIISRDVDLAAVEEDSWIGRYMNGRYDRIRQEQPCVSQPELRRPGPS
jgi:Ser/Thr protein kinase RdoA (MazF antagonist)